ncbi:hypothetical protein FM107_12520 [Sphingobacterium sp. JB170]|nr:hypothetical protein FM107_12520 [Sphingobacterium sp. JB170]
MSLLQSRVCRGKKLATVPSPILLSARDLYVFALGFYIRP